MSLIQKIFGKRDTPIKTYEDFWNWFVKHERTFYRAVNSGKNIEKVFFDRMSPKLSELKDGFFFLTGMYDDDTVELVFTPDGNIKNIVFIEELVQAAPIIKGWKFSPLKSSIDIDQLGIRMENYVFGKDNLAFYPNELVEFPDEIDITVVYQDFQFEDESTIINGTYIFLDNYLGELRFMTAIDRVNVIGPEAAEKELIPIHKLKDFLIWREKEFIEKYDGFRFDTVEDDYSIFEATLNNGKPLLATMNSKLLHWDSKASHPWILTIEIKYDGTAHNGMPDESTYTLLHQIEEEITSQLPDYEGYLNIGRETADSSRDIYFACKDFRKPSKVLYHISRQYQGKQDIEFDIFKDKYWRLLELYTKNDMIW